MTDSRLIIEAADILDEGLKDTIASKASNFGSKAHQLLATMGRAIAGAIDKILKTVGELKNKAKEKWKSLKDFTSRKFNNAKAKKSEDVVVTKDADGRVTDRNAHLKQARMKMKESIENENMTLSNMFAAKGDNITTSISKLVSGSTSVVKTIKSDAEEMMKYASGRNANNIGDFDKRHTKAENSDAYKSALESCKKLDEYLTSKTSIKLADAIKNRQNVKKVVDDWENKYKTVYDSMKKEIAKLVDVAKMQSPTSDSGHKSVDYNGSEYAGDYPLGKVFRDNMSESAEGSNQKSVRDVIRITMSDIQNSGNAALKMIQLFGKVMTDATVGLMQLDQKVVSIANDCRYVGEGAFSIDENGNYKNLAI